MRRILRYILIVIIALSAFIFLNNTNLFTRRPDGDDPLVLAHRGIAQRFDPAGVTNDTCTASRILPPKHGYLENTIASMRASFEVGADIVELDVHPTTDGQFVVFHDWTLDCRTDGHGVTREHSVADLKKLDIGYGYTADGGRTYPFRGSDVGMMPTLAEVLQAFPDRPFLINVKSNDPDEGSKLATFLNALPPERRATVMAYGGDRPIAALRTAVPGLKTMSRASLKGCLLRYIAYGWTGAMPDECRSTVVLVPINVAPWLWGWPDRYLNRMDSVGSTVFVVGPYHGGDFSTGMDSVEELSRLPENYSGGVLTNEIEMVASWLRSRK
ncbi:glycerophosphodiester phosphodiesterase family protein [Agrobacterium burrii]|uniref:Glycerophosphodiester phosphodiesterase n=1 Tax=Agrobacterium burrii TaxID=2815339 RepID=A0ABS3EQJ5_9HYPH|nr:glycerophosphodiester phosphodiesterase family protein [Agrobacterium burrii]MBO0134285.1 glycerophosphodiester phosphodiesterase [Agrobacterium burrii]